MPSLPFPETFSNPMMKSEIRAPIQNERSVDAMPAQSPRAQPIERESLPSPRPIQLPLETNQKNQKNMKRIGPAMIRHGSIAPVIHHVFPIRRSDTKAALYEKKSGMILCRIS